MIVCVCSMTYVSYFMRSHSAKQLNVSAPCLCPTRDRKASQWFYSISTVIARSRTRDSRTLVAVTAVTSKGVGWIAKSRYDRNVDKGAAQQRNYGQGARRKDDKPGTAAEEPVRPPRHGGGPKNPGGPAREEPPWRPKSRGDNG